MVKKRACEHLHFTRVETWWPIIYQKFLVTLTLKKILMDFL